MRDALQKNDDRDVPAKHIKGVFQNRLLDLKANGEQDCDCPNDVAGFGEAGASELISVPL
jgi:hypothetical protein